MKRSFLHRLLSVVSAFLIVALTLSGLVRPAQAAPAPQLNFQMRNPYPTSNALNSVVYAGGQFVAVGYNGTIVTSSDGSTWKTQNPAPTSKLSSIAYGGGQFTAVGRGVSVTSPDGKTWNSKSSGLPGAATSVTYGTVAGKDLWVAVGNSNTIVTSPDGLSWSATSVTPPSPAVDFGGITYTGTQFVAWGRDPITSLLYAYTSTDGSNWVPHKTNYGTSAGGIFYDASSNLLVGIDIGGSSTAAYASTDGGKTWAQLSTSFSPLFVAFGAGKTVAVDFSQQSVATLNKTPQDPTTWTWSSPVPVPTSGGNLNGIAYGNGTFVAVGGGGTIVTSTDGATWTPVNYAYNNLRAIVYDGTNFVTTNGPLLIKSPDGSTWQAKGPTPPVFDGLWYSNGKYLGLSYGFLQTFIYVYSDNAQTWKSGNPTGMGSINGIAYNGTTYVAVDGNGKVTTSADGQNWSSAPQPLYSDSSSIHSLIYAGGRLVAVGKNTANQGAIYVSDNGTTWNPATWQGSQPSGVFNGVAYDGQKYLAVGNGGLVATSPDGVKWQAQTTNVTGDFSWVAYGGGQFLGFTSIPFGAGVLMASTDGLTWTPQASPFSYPNGAVYGAGTWVIWRSNSIASAPAAPPTPPAPLPPPAPPVTIIAPAAGLYTNNNLYTFKGNVLVPGSAVTVAIDGSAAGTAKLDASGTQWSFTPAAPLADGTHTVTATANGSTTPAIPFTVKTKPPVLTATLPGSGITNQNKPTVTGTTESGATVALARDGNVVTTLTPDGSGNWSYTFPTVLADGSYSLTFTATDLAGNTTTVTKPLKIKTSIPAVAITPPTGPASVNQPVITGTAEAGSTVALYLGGGWAGTATADSNGAWSVTLPALLDGSYTITASATDAAGNVGWAPGVTLRVATSAQPVAITAPASGSATNQAQPAIAGTAKPGSTVNVTLDGKPVGTVTAGNAGRWQYSPAAPLADGSHTVSAAATDPAGTASATGNIAFTVKTSVPAITLNLPSGNLTTPLSPGGTAEVGSTVKVYVDGNLAATVQPDASGAWSASIPAADGSHTVTATALDAAGNVGKAPALTVQIVPAVTISTPDGARFTTAQPTFTGTAQPGSTVAVILDGTPWGSVTASASGRWSYTPAILADGSHTVSATATDAQGLTGTAPARTFTVNTTPVTLTDIAGNPAADAITALVQQGVFKGFPDGTFRPELGVTRAQLAVIYAKALGLQPQQVAALTFSDRSQIGDWAAPYVAAMVQQGTLHGYPDGTFRPNATISRAELASLLARLLQQRGIKVQASAPVISDQLPAWAADSIRTAAAAGLLSPAANGTFNPAAPATRGQTAQAFYTLLTLLQGH